MQAISKNDTGTVIDIKLIDDDGVVDVSSAIALSVILISPRGEEYVKPAAAAVSGGQPVVRYVTQAADFHSPGRWLVRGRAQFADGSWTSLPGAVDVI